MKISKGIVCLLAQCFFLGINFSYGYDTIERTDDDRVIPLIIGGTSVEDPEKYPWATLLLINSPGEPQFPFCSGSLIHPKVVLTAGHCLREIRSKEDRISVIVGHPRWQDWDSLPIVSYIRHPGFMLKKTGVMVNDVALLFLEKEVDFPTVALAQPSSPFPSSLTALGFGTTHVEWREMSPVLREVQVPAIPRAKCQAMWNRLLPFMYPRVQVVVEETHMCSAGKAGKDACSGDSGGPLVAKTSDTGEYVLHGITSFGYGCAYEGFPAVNTRVDVFYEWIIKTMTREFLKARRLARKDRRTKKKSPPPPSPPPPKKKKVPKKKSPPPPSPPPPKKKNVPKKKSPPPPPPEKNKRKQKS